MFSRDSQGSFLHLTLTTGKEGPGLHAWRGAKGPWWGCRFLHSGNTRDLWGERSNGESAVPCIGTEFVWAGLALPGR